MSDGSVGRVRRWGSGLCIIWSWVLGFIAQESIKNGTPETGAEMQISCIYRHTAKASRLWRQEKES